MITPGEARANRGARVTHQDVAVGGRSKSCILLEATNAGRIRVKFTGTSRTAVVEPYELHFDRPRPGDHDPTHPKARP